jgi:hypothetical protein
VRGFRELGNAVTLGTGVGRAEGIRDGLWVGDTDTVGSMDGDDVHIDTLPTFKPVPNLLRQLA